MFVTEFVRELEGKLLLHTWKVNPVTGTAPIATSMLSGFQLEQNYPNPFNPETVIEYQLPRASEVEISIFSLKGQKVATLLQEYRTAGSYKIIWNGKDEFGRPVASGVYLYQLKTGKFVALKKMLLLR